MFEHPGAFSMTSETINRARRLRREMTPAEHRLWSALRNNRFGFRRFRRQHPVGSYFADFACVSAGLILELDGGQHADDAHAAYDRARTRYLNREGFQVMRIWNHEVLKNLPGVLDAIDVRMMEMGVEVRERPHPAHARHPLP
jgi:very-short-patch-repair endonuclease